MRPKAIYTLLETVRNQTLYPDEILIIDGSVDDKTKHVFDKLSFKNLTYHKVLKNNRGLTKQRNFGIKQVSEFVDIICFLDDDIILYTNYFKNLISTYKSMPNALGVGGYIANETTWHKGEIQKNTDFFNYDGYHRIEGSRFKLRKSLSLLDNTPPGFMPKFSNGRSIGFLPPSGKVYQVEQMMGGVSSFKKEVFETIRFSEYFEGYGLYEDADFSLRLAKKGKLFVNTKAALEHHHADEGRPNQFKYGKMVVRNGWYVWRVKYKNVSFINRFKWNAIAIVLTLIRIGNIITTKNKVKALTESLGRIVGLISLIFNKPKVIR